MCNSNFVFDVRQGRQSNTYSQRTTQNELQIMCGDVTFSITISQRKGKIQDSKFNFSAVS